MTTYLLLLLWLVVWGFIGYLVGKRKNQVASGIVWPALLGPVGVLVVLALPVRK
jgi:hypothetical protein